MCSALRIVSEGILSKGRARAGAGLLEQRLQDYQWRLPLFFVLRNDSTLPYTGKVTLRLFDRGGKAMVEKTVDFSNAPIKQEAGGPFLIDTQVKAPRFELEHNNEKIEGDTGKFIERL